MSKMEIGVLTILRRYRNPFETLQTCQVNTCQVTNWDMSLYTDEFAELTRRQMTDAGVRIAGFWGGYSGRIVWNSSAGPATCGLVPRDLRNRRVEELKRGADFAKILGAPALITHCGFIPENPGDPLYPETLNAIYEVASYCNQLGLGFWFESGQETPLTLLRTIEDLALPNLGVNLDTANLILYGRGNPVDALEVIGKYVRNCHIKDGVFPKNGYSLGEEVPVGTGKADFPKIIRKLYELDFSGELIIEREISGEKQIADIMQAKELLTRLTAQYAPGK